MYMLIGFKLNVPKTKAIHIALVLGIFSLNPLSKDVRVTELVQRSVLKMGDPGSIPAWSSIFRNTRRYFSRVSIYETPRSVSFFFSFLFCGSDKILNASCRFGVLQVSSSEYFSVSFEVGDDTASFDREEFLPATKGTYLVWVKHYYTFNTLHFYATCEKFQTPRIRRITMRCYL